MSKDLLALIDGSSYLYRAFHAMPSLTNSEGQPTGAMYGVINMLKKLIKDHDPKYIAIVFDAKGKTFRHELYEDYKGTRPEMPEELQQQIKPLYEIIQAMHIPLLCVEGVEADDVIGTLVKQASKAGIETLVSTGDKDMAQLVDDNTTLINTMTDTRLDRQGVIKKFGVPPEKIIDYLSLVGDTSDNIPGVPKVGPKTAVKWLEAYGDLDGVVNHAEEIPGKVGENLKMHKDQLPLAVKLVTINKDLQLPYKIGDLIPGTPDKERLTALYQHYEFKSWLKELLSDKPAKKIEKHYETILSESQFDDWIERLKVAELFAFDTETNSLRYMDAEVVGVSFATEIHKAAYLPFAHCYPGAPEQLNREKVLEKLKPILESDKHKKVGHNLKYDKEVLANHGIELKGIAFDTMLESYVVDSTASRHDMDTLALKYLGHKNISYEDVAGKGAKQITFDQVDLEIAAPYAAEDADITLQLHEHLWPKIKDDEKLTYVFEKIEMPLVPILSEIEYRGVQINCDLLKEQSQALGKEIERLQKEAFELAGKTFNLNSPKQLQQILFEEQGLPIVKKTPKGQASTAEEVLKELALEYDLPDIILSFRSFSKLKSTYTDRLPEQVNEKTGRVHTSYHQAVAGTGRLSSSDPNLQNIPVRTKEGRAIRKAFTSPRGYKLLAADYSQIELRIMAHLSQDKGLLHAFEKGLDIHKATASQVFGTPLFDVTAEQRRRAKAINFGLIYGMSAFGLAKQLGVERAAAQAYIDAYFEQYPGVHDYMERTRKHAHEKGYVETIKGRRLHLPEINAKNRIRQNAAERAAINAPMQGTAADIIKLAMINIHQWLAKQKLDARMVMQVHDELVFEVKDDETKTLEEALPKLMDEVIKLDIPLTVDIGIGNNWEEAH